VARGIAHEKSRGLERPKIPNGLEKQEETGALVKRLSRLLKGEDGEVLLRKSLSTLPRCATEGWRRKLAASERREIRARLSVLCGSPEMYTTQ
jgi:hypothetical protein